jgi:enterochelin esterase-like enzyme
MVRRTILLVAILLLPALCFAQVQPVAQAATPQGQRVPAVVSPEIGSDGRVTFRLRAPSATEVSVAGLSDPLPMTKDAQGVWSATTASGLAPDIYLYTFTVDGVRVPDPVNLTNSWVSSPSSTLLIPGVPWANSDVPHGAVARHVYKSPIIGGLETYYVYTPPDYDPKRKVPYPVLVTLHGLGGSGQDWIVSAGANLTLDTLIIEGKAEPMILISPAGQGNTGGTRAAAAGFPNFTKALLEEILPQVEKQYNASNKTSDRAITGLSMGAAQSLLLLNHLDKFAWIGSFSPGFDMFNPQWGTSAVAPTVNGQRPVLAPGQLENTFPALDSNANSKIKLLYLACGTADDHLALTRQFKDFLDARKIKVTYVEGEGFAHAYPFWRRQLAAFAPMLFKPHAD